MAGTDAVLNETGIRTLRRKPVFTSPNVFPPPDFEPSSRGDASTADPQHCYICKQKFSDVHHFYDQMCPPCAEFNFRKRTELADLRGRVALLTGGRVKIGYQAGIKLLRAGARLIVTTRFPRDSAQRYAQEPDFERVGTSPGNLRPGHAPHAQRRGVLPAVAEKLFPRLDFIINNACQTVRRPPEFYAHMMEGERAALHEMPARARRLLGAYDGKRGFTASSQSALSAQERT